MKKTKSLIALLVALCLFLAIVPFKVFANESYTFTFAVQSGTNHQIVVENEALIIDGGYVEARDANNQNIGKAKYENGVYKIVVESGEETELNFGGNNFTLYMQGHSYQMGTKLSANEDFQVQDYEEPNPPGPGPGPDDGGNNGPVEIDGGTLVTGHFNYESKGEGQPADIWLNETAIGVGEPPAESADYYYIESQGTVRFRFGTFVNNRITSVKINGIDYSSQLPQTKEQWLESNQNQFDMVEITVPYAETYNIETITTNEFDWSIGNFLWSYMDKDKGTDDYLGNGKLEFVSIKHNGTTYNGLDELRNSNKQYLYFSQNEDEGGAVLPAGATLTVKLIPNAGYQLTSFTCNGQEFTPQEQIGTYTFEVPGGNFHWGASFTKVDDAVKASSNKIQSGTITLGGTESSMAIGTARLDVKDTEVTDEQVEKFKETAGDYTISNYLDISLFNTVYKGKATSSWDTEVTELDNKANVSLKLDDSIKGEDAIVVHEKHDGTLEIVDSEYDKESNSINFGTKEFSNYAIATKGTVTSTEESNNSIEAEDETKENETTNESAQTQENTSSNPSTGDRIMTFVAVFSIALAVMLIALITNKSKKVSKH